MEFPDLVKVQYAAATANKVNEQLARKALAGNGTMMMAELTLEAGAVFPGHNHPFDQLTYVASGHIRVEAAGETFEARTGDSFVLKADVPHQISAIERSVTLDTFDCGPTGVRQTAHQVDNAGYPDLVVVKHADAPAFEAFENLTRKVLAFNGALMLTEHTMAAGSVFPRHNHPHEQLAYLVSGHIRVEAAGEIFEAHAGDSFVLKGDVFHQVWAIERSVALDLFTPLRADYLMHAAAPGLEAAKAAAAVTV